MRRAGNQTHVFQLKVTLLGIKPPGTDGRRACPPEDRGGPWGYAELLDILADRSHPESEERVMWVGEWGGGRQDPDSFHPVESADNLAMLRAARLDD